VTEPDLYTLAYFSRNAIEDAQRDLRSEVESILAAARRNNRQRGVTGALLYSKGCFAQVLEGPLVAVESIFESIECDPRHTDITVIHFKPCQTRSFGAWSMAFTGFDEQVASTLNIEGLLNDASQIDSNQAGGDLVSVLRDLIARHEAVDALPA
jgi:Sensors of blue-light using FAD